MSDVTDWLAAAGGIVGAIGGPAGLWAARNQHRANNKPPAELFDALFAVERAAIEIAVAHEPSAHGIEWFEARHDDRLEQLSMKIRNSELSRAVWDLCLMCKSMPYMPSNSAARNEVLKVADEAKRVTLLARKHL
ncbi:hypothetical protein ACTWQF_30125 [Streptomyces sp. 8N114]|uniref:hypothetical protein n=1 Tax=Streptomyces sp. 8N114 TaxID=3457419 RepID=UPI003FD43AF9